VTDGIHVLFHFNIVLEKISTHVLSLLIIETGHTVMYSTARRTLMPNSTTYQLKLNAVTKQPSRASTFKNLRSRRKTPLEIHFTYLGNKEIYSIIKTCCIISVVFRKMQFIVS
jgi:hypothetical protein